MSIKVESVNDIFKKKEIDVNIDNYVRDITDSNKVIRTAELVPSMVPITEKHVKNFVKVFKKKHDLKDEKEKQEDPKTKDKKKDDDSTSTDKGK